MNLRPTSHAFRFVSRFFILFAAILAVAAPAATVPLSTALDGAGLAWLTGGSDTSATGAPLTPVWSGQTTVSQDGADAARAPALITPEAESWLETTVTGPGTLSWQWRLDLPDQAAYLLEFQVGGEGFPRRSLFSNTPWTVATETISASGPVTLRWRLVRTFAPDVAATDAAFVDAVAFTAFGPPVLQNPSAVNARGFTARWTALPAATGYVLEIGSSADFSGAVQTIAIPAPADSCVVTQLQPLATYHYRLTAQGPDQIEALSAISSVTLPAIQRPSNDAFAAAAPISGANGSVSGTTLDSTTQTDEPLFHQGSVWFTWTAPTAGRWSFQVAPTTPNAPVPALVFYTGSSVGGLAEVASGSVDGRLEFETAAGVAYRIAIDASTGAFNPEDAQGPFTLSWERLALHTPPANDAFANSVRLNAASGLVTGSNAFATTEPGEPASTGGGRTVWWRWTSTATGLATFNASGSAITPTLAAYTGFSVGTLSLVGSGVSTLSIPVVKDTTYHLALDGVNDAQGALSLAWSVAAASVTQTLTFGSLPDVGRNAQPFPVFASSDSGLPVTVSLVSGPATLDDGVLTLTGAAGTVRLRATQPGDAVYLPASLETTFAVRSGPANDAFANAIALGGAAVTGTNLFATAEALDPFPGRSSVWWRHTATAAGVLTLDTAASAISTTLVVLTGTSDADFQIVAADTRIGVRAQVRFPVAAGVTYRIAADSLDAQGAIHLAWSFEAPSQSQTITFDPLPDVGISAAPFSLEAASDSGLPVVFALAEATPAATLANGFLSFTGQPGVVKIVATQPGDAYYAAATPVARSFTVRPPPANDAFARSVLLTGAAVTGFNIDATAESFDPFPASHSVWWHWTAAATGVLTLDTTGSAIPTTLSVLTGTPDKGLETVASDLRPGERARLEIPVSAGVTYRICVDAYENLQGAIRLGWSFAKPSLPQTITFEPLPDAGLGASGFYLNAVSDSGLPVSFSLDGATPAATLIDGFLSLTGKPGLVKVVASQSGDAYYMAAASVTRGFTVHPPPPNDAFANAAALTGSVVNGSNIDASAESFDPSPASHSVWWRWTAPATGVLTLDTTGSAIPATLSVLTGASSDALTLVASDIRADAPARLELPVAAGVTYHIAVDALEDRRGGIRLAWTFAKPTKTQTITFGPIANRVAGDAPFAIAATASSGLPVTLTRVSGPATLEDGLVTLTNQPGTVTITAAQPGDAYYLPAKTITRTFTVAKAPAIKFTFSGLKQTYDGTERVVTATMNPAPRHAPLVITYSGPGHPASTVAPKNAGTYTVVATADSTRVTTKLVVEKAPLVVTARSARKLAGQDNPPLSFSYGEFQAQDDESAVSKAPVVKTTATKTSPGKAAGYPITLSGGQSANYRFVFVPGILQVDTFAGRYEALLTDPVTDLPVAKLELNVSSSGAPFTGTLTLPTEADPVSIKGALTLDSVADTASVVLPIKTKTRLYSLSLNIPLLANIPPQTARFSASLTSGDQPFGATASGRGVFVPASGQKLDWTGAHTAILSNAASLSDSEEVSAATAPAGSGHAIATIDAKGNLKLAGTLADGSPLTATLAPDASGAYRLFARPYGKRLQSQIAGVLPFSPHPDLPARRHLPASAGQSVYWTKAALPETTKTPDKSYRKGFGPLGLTVTIDPWLPPVAANPKAKPPVSAVTLADRLRLAADSTGAAAFFPDFGPDDLDLGQLVNPLPTALALSAKNVVSVTSPVADPANASKFTLKISPSTGAFSGSFTLSDRVPAAIPKNPDATKLVPRTVTFTGVLRQAPESDESNTFGAGYFLVSPLPGATDTSRPSGEISLLRP